MYYEICYGNMSWKRSRENIHRHNREQLQEMQQGPYTALQIRPVGILRDITNF
jgi:hypothetical protein